MTHSVLGRDKRCPATQQMGVKEDEKGTFEESVIYFFRKKAPLCLVELTTPVFKYYQDVDIILQDQNVDAYRDQELVWTELLIKTMGAVLGTIWRTLDDELGIEQAKETTEIVVFGSSGFAKRYGKHKISLHLIFPELHVNVEQAKMIRNSTLAFIEKWPKRCTPLYTAQQQWSEQGGKARWSEILDKASAEGTSLRMPYCDKPCGETGAIDTTEGRPKLPIGKWKVSMHPCRPRYCETEKIKLPAPGQEIEWLKMGSIRLLPEEIIHSHICCPATLFPTEIHGQVQERNRREEEKIREFRQKEREAKGKGSAPQKGRGKSYQGSGAGVRKPKVLRRDEKSWVADVLKGYWMDAAENVMNVWVDPYTGKIQCFKGETQEQIGTLTIDGDPTRVPVNLSYHLTTPHAGCWKYQCSGVHEMQGVWEYHGENGEKDKARNWWWRRGAVFKIDMTPSWLNHIHIYVAGDVCQTAKVFSLGVVVECIRYDQYGSTDASNIAQKKEVYNGTFRLREEQFAEVLGTTKIRDVQQATIALSAAAFGLRVLTDLRLDGYPLTIYNDCKILQTALEKDPNDPRNKKLKKPIDGQPKQIAKLFELRRSAHEAEVTNQHRNTLGRPTCAYEYCSVLDNKAVPHAKSYKTSQDYWQAFSGSVGDWTLWRNLKQALLESATAGSLNQMLHTQQLAHEQKAAVSQAIVPVSQGPIPTSMVQEQALVQAQQAAAQQAAEQQALSQHQAQQAAQWSAGAVNFTPQQLAQQWQAQKGAQVYQAPAAGMGGYMAGQMPGVQTGLQGAGMPYPAAYADTTANGMTANGIPTTTQADPSTGAPSLGQAYGQYGAGYGHPSIAGMPPTGTAALSQGTPSVGASQSNLSSEQTAAYMKSLQDQIEMMQAQIAAGQQAAAPQGYQYPPPAQ